MTSDRESLGFLLDEHYPGWLAEDLVADGVDAVSLTAHRVDLRGVDDTEVLRAAVAESRVVVTEDVRTFGVAAVQVPEHVGIVFCHHRRFPRTRPGLQVLRKALVDLSLDPPPGLGHHPITWWLEAPRHRPRGDP